MIDLAGISVSFGDTVAVRDASFFVDAGEIVALIGHNGAGKTTTLGVMTASVTPSAGIVEFDGERLTGSRRDLRCDIGFVPDHPVIYPHMTGREYIRFVAGLYGCSARDAEREMSALVERFGIQSAIKAPLASASHGTRQKVVLAAMLAHRPRLILLDEPLVGLDPSASRIILEEITARAKDGCAVVFSTHLLSTASAIADRIVVLDGGSVVADATLKEITASLPGIAPGDLEGAFFALTSHSVRSTDSARAPIRAEQTDIATELASLVESELAGRAL